MTNILTYKGKTMGTVKGERMTVMGTAEALEIDIVKEYFEYDVIWEGNEYARNTSFDGKNWNSENRIWKNGELVECIKS